MLQVGIHDAKNFEVGLIPAVEDCAGEATLAFANDQPHARLPSCKGGDYVTGSIGAVVVDDKNLPRNFGGIEDTPNMSQKTADIAGFAESGNDERKSERPGICSPEGLTILLRLCCACCHRNVGSFYRRLGQNEYLI